jgi:hypothetical protein
MNTKNAVIVIVVVLVLAGGWIWYQRTHSATVNEPLKQEFAWSFVDLGVDASTSVPKTDVSLRIAGVNVPLGVYDGNCFSVAGSSWQLLSGEVSGAICYWAGGGKEVGVFEEGGKLVLKEGIVDEGDAEHPGSRSDFKLLTKQLGQ